MRKNALYIILIPIVILLFITYLFMDSWVEYGIETAGEKTVGAKVEIDDLNITFDPIGIEWNKIQVADPNNPWSNLFETGRVKFSMDAAQLLRGKYIIDTVEVSDFTIGTKRTTDGSLPAGERENALLYGVDKSISNTVNDVLQQTIADNPVLDIDRLKRNFNADSLIKIVDIKTLAHIDSVKSIVTTTSKQWENATSDFETSKQRLLQIEQNIKAINPDELNNAQNIISTIAKVDDALKGVNEIQQTFLTRYNSINTDINSLSSLVGSIDDVAKSDFNKLKGMAKLPTLNTSGIAQILVGYEMYKRVMNYFSYIDIAKENIKEYTPEPEYEKQPRFEGQDISFPEEKGYPKFWVKNVKLSGGTTKQQSSDYFEASGKANNITDNQNLTGSPLTFEIAGTNSDKRDIEISGLIDRRTNSILDEYKVKLSGVALKAFELGNNDFISTKITDARMNAVVSIALPGNSFDAKFDINLSNLKLLFANQPRNTVERLAMEVLKGISTFNVEFRMWNTNGPVKVALATDLDNLLSQKLTSVLGDEVNRMIAQLRSKFDAVIADKRSQFEKYYNEQLAVVQNKLGDYQSLLNGNLSLIDSKKADLESRLKKVEQGLGNQLLDLLKKKS